MTKLYNIVLNPGYNQTDLYSMVSTVTDELLHRPTFFIAECTEEQALALENHEAVKFCQSDEDVPEIEDGIDTCPVYVPSITLNVQGPLTP